MSDQLFEMYCKLNKLIEEAKNCPDSQDDAIKLSLEGWEKLLEDLNANSWGFKRRYEVIKSFTPDQIDHICYQIGDWYLMMKPLLEGQHNLGYMKEKLKVMICGEPDV